MKKYIKLPHKTIFIIFFSILFVQTELNATHAIGGDITYRLIDTALGRYLITLNLYRDCSGIMYGNEQLSIQTSTVNTTLPMTLVGKTEVTPICRVPDVATTPVTNCPSGSIGSYKGIEKWTFELVYTLGKNTGWAVLGWSGCCRNNIVSTIQNPGGQGIWIQALVNTNYQNSSPIFDSMPIPYICRLKNSVFGNGTRQIYDPKYITINGKPILLDSISYKLYTPFTAQASNPSIAAALGNPSVSFNTGLNANNFLYSTSGVSFDAKTGRITCIPSITQDAIIATAVMEYRAIPDATVPAGYRRELVGYTTRDIQFTVRDICDNITNLGVIADSLRNSNYVASDEVDMLSDKKNIRIMFKILGAQNQASKLKVIYKPDTTVFKGFKFNHTIQTVSNVDAIYGVIDIDSLSMVTQDMFAVEVYYCTSIGMKIAQKYFLKLNIKPNFCTSIGDTPIYSNLNIRRVKLTGVINPIDNETNCNSLVGTQGTGIGIAGRYADFTSTNVPKSKIMLGKTFQVSISDTNCMAGLHYYTKAVFIDWNGNTNFSDAGERYNVSVSPFNLKAEAVSITVPTNAFKGKIRMRVVTRMDTPANNLMPCGSTLNANMNQGETEDYELEMIDDFTNCSYYSGIVRISNGSSFTFTPSDTSTLPYPYSISYLWTFSNGFTSTQKSPTVSFSLGNHWAKLKICIDSGTTNLCCDSSIHSFKYCNLSGSITKLVDTLTANATNGIAPYTYLWSNGATTKSVTVSTSGNYYVTITDSVGCTTNVVYNIQGTSTLCSYYKDFSWTNIGSNHTFYPNPNIPAGLYPDILWTVSNGATSNLAQPMFSLNPNSTYVVKYKYCLRDSNMTIICCDSVVKQVQTTGGNTGGGIPCNLKANFKWTPLSSGIIQFNDSSTPMTSQMYTYYWTFGDGTSSTQKNPVKVYSTNGTKNVCLLVRRWLNSNSMYCEDTICKTVNVTGIVPCNRLNPNFSYSSILGGNYQLTNTTNMTGFNLISISYQILNTSTTYNIANPTHTFATNGYYGVTMTITVFDVLSGTTCTKSITKTFYVNTNVCACLQAYNTYTKSGKTIQFADMSLCTDTNTTYHYNFGNGASSTLPNPSYTYPLPGLYRTVMTITRTIGANVCKDSLIRVVQINTSNLCKDSGYTVYYNYPCPNYYSPVCGCDTVTYQSYCHAARAGVKQYTNNPCPNDTSYVKICGYVYIDVNKNCSYDTSDIALSNIAVKFNTNPIKYAYTNSIGYYQVYLPKGTYQISQVINYFNPAIGQLCPAGNGSITVNATTGGATYCNNNFFDTTSTCPDLAVAIYRGSRITPGFTSRKVVNYYNRGATPINNAVLKYRFLSGLTVKSTTSATYSVSGNVITWNLGTIPAYSGGIKHAELQVPTSLALGTTVIDSVWIEPLTGDCNPNNNLAIFNDTCVGSYDPNDKAAYPPSAIDTSVKTIDYLVRFQNTGTAPAHNVRVEDVIDDKFEKSSLRINSYSHKMQTHYSENGKVYFEFPEIMLPDSGTDYDASQGYVAYSINLKNNLPVGTQLKNTAEIYFDFNEPIITNTTVNTIVLKSGSSVNTLINGTNVSIYPNPTQYVATLETELDKAVDISYTLFDIQGKLLESKDFDRHPAGSFKCDVSLEKLPKGIYVLQLKLGSKETSFKLVKE